MRQAHRNGSGPTTRVPRACRLATLPASRPVESFAGGETNKNPIRPRRTGLHVSSRSLFRGGNEPCAHRLGCTGGGSFRTARCRDDLAHSLSQEASAGRNLITLFHSVNNLAKYFSAPRRRDGGRWRRQRHVVEVPTAALRWRGVTMCFCETAFFKYFFYAASFRSCIRAPLLQVPDGRSKRPLPVRPSTKFFFGSPVLFATQHGRLRDFARTIFRP